MTTPPQVRIHTNHGETLPLIADLLGPVDSPSWLSANREWVEIVLLQYGALLFRGFNVSTVEAFQDFSHAISAESPDLLEESSPRRSIGGNVMTSTDYPAEYPIQFHNEYSYSQTWPLRLYFCCLYPPETAGRTPIADSLRVLGPSTGSRLRFAELGVMYQRNYIEGLGVSWQDAYRPRDREEVMARCAELGISCTWRDGGALTTIQKAEAILPHPVTGEDVWFNHAFFFNPQSLEPESLREFMLGEPEGELSTITRYGDGTAIEMETIAEIRAAYEAERSVEEWVLGDVLLIDNMLVSHAREPYTGTRRIAVAMSDLCSRATLHSALPRGSRNDTRGN